MKAEATPKQETSVARNAGRMSIAVLISRILGLVREQVFAYFFGAGLASDAYLVAFRVPNLLRDLFAEGALSSAFVSVFAREPEGERAQSLSRHVITVMTLIVGFVCLALLGASPLIVKQMAGDFAKIEGKLELTIGLTKILVPFLYLASMAALAMGILNSLGSFFLPSMGSAAFNLANILVGGAFAYHFRNQGNFASIYAFTWATLLGGFFQWSIQWPGLKRRGFAPLAGIWDVFSPTKVRSACKDTALRNIFRLMAPAVLSVAAVQINVMVDTSFAAALQQGSVAWLSFAFRIMHFPMGVFGVALSTATLPRLSKLVHEKNFEGFEATLEESLKWTLLLALGSAAMLIVFRNPIVALLYQRGHFSPQDTLMTGQALAAFSLGLLAFNGSKIFIQAFYALDQIWVPSSLAGLNIAMNYVLDIYFSRWWGPAGLALSTAGTSLLNMLLLLFVLHKKKRFRISGRLGRVILASGLGAAGLGAVAFTGFPDWLLNFRATAGTLVFAPVLLGTLALSGLLYLLVVALIAPEGRAFSKKLASRFKRASTLKELEK